VIRVAGQAVSDEDRVEAIRLALAGIARGGDVNGVLRDLVGLHPKHSTFPVEVFLELGADALRLAGVSRDRPLEYEGLFDRFLAECSFRGRSQNERRHYALRAIAMIHGGVRPDLLDDTYWWGDIEDFWSYAFFALTICVRAAADRLGEPVADVARRLASGRCVTLPTDD
jgi:hypothetical protein